MKRLFIIVLILTLILFVAVSGVVYARNTCEELVSMTEEAKRLRRISLRSMFCG